MLPVVLLLTHCLLLLSLFVVVLYLVLVLLIHVITLCPTSFVIILMGKPCDSKYVMDLITVPLVRLWYFQIIPSCSFGYCIWSNSKMTEF